MNFIFCVCNEKNRSGGNFTEYENLKKKKNLLQILSTYQCSHPLFSRFQSRDLKNGIQ